MGKKNKNTAHQSSFSIENSTVSNSFNKTIGSFNKQKNTADPGTVLKELRKLVSSSGNIEAGIAFGSLQSEFDKAPRDKTKLKEAWSALRKALPSVNESTGIVANISSLFS